MFASKYECLSVSGSCRGLMGLGNGTAHTSQATCENAHDCGVYEQLAYLTEPIRGTLMVAVQMGYQQIKNL